MMDFMSELLNDESNMGDLFCRLLTVHEIVPDLTFVRDQIPESHELDKDQTYLMYAGFYFRVA